MNKRYSKRYETNKPNIYKVFGRWVWAQSGFNGVVKEKNAAQIFVDKLNNSKF